MSTQTQALAVVAGSDSATVLAVNPAREDLMCLAAIFGRSPFKLQTARSLKECLEVLHRQYVSVVLCERQLPDGDWKDILAYIETLADPPKLIVTSLHADDRLWSEVLNLGGYDVVAKPFVESEVMRIVETASLRWREERPQRAGVASEPAVFTQTYLRRN
jgi:DNA-binding NtrC family response regulator